MKAYPQQRPARHIRVPAFAPVPLRTRQDGWTPERQGHFLAELARLGSVAGAARAVAMSREGAYALRRAPEAGSFAAAWDAVLRMPSGPQRKLTPEEVMHRALSGLIKPVIWRGRVVATTWKTDGSMLLRAMRQANRGRFRGP